MMMRTLITALLIVATSTAAAAQALPDLDLEQLMRIDAGRVFGASERMQPVTEAPSSVSFITANEIARLVSEPRSSDAPGLVITLTTAKNALFSGTLEGSAGVERLYFARATADTPAVVAGSGALGTRWSIGGRISHPLPGRQVLTVGAEFIDNVAQNQWGRYLDPPATLYETNRSTLQHAAYVQDELKVARWLIVNAGVRYDGYEAFDRITPRAALIVTPSPTQGVMSYALQRTRDRATRTTLVNSPAQTAKARLSVPSTRAAPRSRPSSSPSADIARSPATRSVPRRRWTSPSACRSAARWS
jgi:hypothetical protein